MPENRATTPAATEALPAVIAMIDCLEVSDVAELERALRATLHAPTPAFEARRRQLGDLARLLLPPILGSLPVVDRVVYDAERAAGAPTSHALSRQYGSWTAACLAAAATAPNGAVRGPHHPWSMGSRGRSRPEPYSDWEIDEAIRSCARDLGHVPSCSAYRDWALRRRRDERAKGVWPVRIPTHATIQRRKGGWRAAIGRWMG